MWELTRPEVSLKASLLLPGDSLPTVDFISILGHQTQGRKSTNSKHRCLPAHQARADSAGLLPLKLPTGQKDSVQRPLEKG